MSYITFNAKFDVLAVILVGGIGKRLLPYTTLLPKTMLPLKNKPLLEYIINWLKRNKITSIILCASYMYKIIKNYFKDGAKFGVNIQYAISQKRLSTAGQLKTAEKLVDDRFVCIYGDALYNFNLQNAINRHKHLKAFSTICVCKHKLNFDYGVINTKNDHITSWIEKPTITRNINIGCIIFENSIFNFIPKQKSYAMNNLVNTILKMRKYVCSFMIDDDFYDIGNIKQYEYMCKIVK